MAAGGMLGGNADSNSAGSSRGTIPFQLGTHDYAERQATTSWQLTTTTNEVVTNITPGGFLRGVRLLLSSAGGVAGTLTADAPYIMLQSVSLENIDGSPILYPMNGYSYAMAIKYFMPWLGDPAKNYFYSTAIATPGWVLTLRNEIRNTAAVLANTDARAQYRFRYTFNTLTSVGSGYTTAPTVSGVQFMESYTQTDPTDLNGNPVQSLPDGLNLARVIRHQFVNLAAAGGNNTIQLTNTGNEIRAWMMIARDGSGVRQNALSDPIRLRLDDRSLFVVSPDELWQRMYDFYPFLANGTSTRETGLYVVPRFRDFGVGQGTFWLQTSNATYLMVESTTAAGISGNGTVEIITDEVIPVGAIPAELEGV